MLCVKNLRVSYGNIRALHGIDFEMADGEIVCIIGANGAGKSTTLRAISRLIPCDSDSRMEFFTHDLTTYTADKVVSRLGISHVPEGRRLFGNLTVHENLKLAGFTRKNSASLKKDYGRVYDLFPKMAERRKQRSETLSGGEQQMLSVSRAIMTGCNFILLDEPSMGLAPLMMLGMFEALKEINRQGTSILLVEQNARLALKFATRGYVLENGQMVLSGDADSLLHNPDVKKAYLGG